MNFPGVLAKDPDVLDKIRIVGQIPIDGHAPGLTGRELCAYIATGIRSDHEATTLEEGREKLQRGMHVMIREGSVARNLDALLPLVTPDTLERFMFVTDDKRVDDLLNEGHIDHIVRRAVSAGLQPAYAIRLASFNAARYYDLHDMGAIAPGYLANLAVLDNLTDCHVTRVYRGGQLVAADGQCVAPEPPAKESSLRLRSSINVRWLTPEDFVIQAPDRRDHAVRVIELIQGDLRTGLAQEPVTCQNGVVVSDPARDLLKLAVIERHTASGNIGLGLVRGFGFRRGAIASTIAHDAHNLIVVGVNDADMLAAAVHLVQIRGGLCVAEKGEVIADLPLPIAGVLSDAPAAGVKQNLLRVRAAARSLGTPLDYPFMALSFLSLSVIGDLKLTDRGLVDVSAFRHVDLFV
jgi:adenine deaminase